MFVRQSNAREFAGRISAGTNTIARCLGCNAARFRSGCGNGNAAIARRAGCYAARFHSGCGGIASAATTEKDLPER